MRNFLSIRLLLVVVLSTLFFSGVTLASDRKGAMSPYFQVLGDPSLVDSVPLLQSHADINIAGTIADVVVRQTYKNAGEKPIEAIYVFPGSTRSAVYGMTLKVAGRTIIAEIQEKEQARKAYEEARDAGKTTSLLEQHRPNVFQMSIGNILPGEIVEVELKYTELLFPESGRYQFVYPAVVGPRYVDASGEGAEYAAMPYGASGKNPEYLFSIEAKINAPTQLSGISSDSHKINVSYQGENSAKISLEDSEVVGGNRDFILDYMMTESAISAGAISYEGDENFVLFMVQPPGKTVDADIPGREYIFVVDISGSMHGWPIAVSQDLMGGLVSRLRPTDLFNIVFFAGGSNVVFPASQPATPENLKKAYAALDNSSAGGGTELLQALIKAKELPASKGFSRSTVILTDGYIGADGQLMDFISGNLDVSNYFAVGIGGSVNRNVIEGIARFGRGEPLVVMDQNSARSQGAEFLDAIREPVFAGITYQYDESVFYDVMPDKTGDIFSSKPIYIVAKYKAPLQGSFIISGNSAKGPVKIPISLENVKADDSNQAVRYLWAREAIAVFSDQEVYARQSRKDEITALGLQYGLLTNYTSFVAIDQYVRNVSGEMETVKQPLPMPKHVSNRAIGGGSAFPLYSFRLGQSDNKSLLHDSYGKVIDRAYIEDNLFFIRDDVWIDARHDPSIVLIDITKDSEALKSLISRFPWAEILIELGVKFIVSDGKNSFAYGV